MKKKYFHRVLITLMAILLGFASLISNSIACDCVENNVCPLLERTLGDLEDAQALIKSFSYLKRNFARVKLLDAHACITQAQMKLVKCGIDNLSLWEMMNMMGNMGGDMGDMKEMMPSNFNELKQMLKMMSAMMPMMKQMISEMIGEITDTTVGLMKVEQLLFIVKAIIDISAVETVGLFDWKALHSISLAKYILNLYYTSICSAEICDHATTVATSVATSVATTAEAVPDEIVNDSGDTGPNTDGIENGITVWSADAELIGSDDASSGALTFTASQTGANITVEGDVNFSIYVAVFNMEMPFTLPFEGIPATMEDDNISFSFEGSISTDMGPCPVRFTLDGGAGTFILEILSPMVKAMLGFDTITGSAEIYNHATTAEAVPDEIVNDSSDTEDPNADGIENGIAVWSAEAELIGSDDASSGALTFTASQTGANITVEGDVNFSIYVAVFNMEMPFTLPFEGIPATMEDDNISFSFEGSISTDMGPCPVRFTLDGGAGTFILEILSPMVKAMLGFDTITGTAALTRL